MGKSFLAAEERRKSVTHVIVTLMIIIRGRPGFVKFPEQDNLRT